jgi:hypothetical protein
MQEDIHTYHYIAIPQLPWNAKPQDTDEIKEVKIDLKDFKSFGGWVELVGSFIVSIAADERQIIVTYIKGSTVMEKVYGSILK